MSDPPFWLESPSQIGFALSLISIYLGGIMALAEGMSRWRGAGVEFTRKIVHIGAGNVIILAWWLKIPPVVIVAAATIAAIAALASYYRPILPSINSVGRRSLGTFFYALSIGILVGYFWPRHQPLYAAIGILVMSWGDGLAALVGQRFGRHPYKVWGMDKSWEGSLTMMGVSFLATGILLLAVQGNSWQVWAASVLVAVAATALESFSKWGLDNLLVPLGSAWLALAVKTIIQSSL